MNREEEKFFKKFGAAVRRLRLSQGKTLEDMQEYGFSPQHFQKVEAGKKAVSFYTVLRVAKGLRVSLEELAKGLD